ncbi:MAG: hypothetical protein JETT_2464 [Candidatus Jettenia ecosi]|uniref:Uncharacterized protein n=1 Tax=Candidatus Jettenia ecosi TaxID=2494326 RepID=A0A533QL13_9BACT|nr:MAG: hypothetical protein JETT_2464 [Candidatus Jettenia ecosi]
MSDSGKTINNFCISPLARILMSPFKKENLPLFKRGIVGD